MGMKISRRALLAAALLLILFALALTINWNKPAGDGAGTADENQPTGVWLNDIHIVQLGGEPAAWIWLAGRLDDANGKTLTLDVFAQAQPKRVVLLAGPWAGAGRMDEFKLALKNSLTQFGFALETQNFSELNADDEGRILILPAGAWPAELMQNWEKKIGPKDMVVFFGVRQNVTLDKTGGMSDEVGVRSELLADGEAGGPIADGEMITGLNGGAVWRVPHTLGEYDDLKKLADSLAQGVVSDQAGERVARRSITWQSGARTEMVQLPASWSGNGFARVRLADSAGRTKTMWDSALRGFGGDIEGPAEVKMGQTAAFQIRLQPGLPQNERIGYHAVLYAPNQSRFQELELGEGVIRAGGTWVGSFTYSKWAASGDWRIVVEDQFSRAYAEAAIHVSGYSIDMLAPVGNTYRFRILRDGLPLADGPVSVRRAGSAAWTTANLNQGVLSLSSNWAEGEKKIEVEADGTRLEYSWGQNAEGPWTTALRWGAAGLILAGIVYWLLRPRSRPTYRIRIGELPMIESKQVRLDMHEMKAVMETAAQRQGWKRPDEWALRAEDVMESLHQAARGGRPVMASLESVEKAMDGLAQDGLLCRWREWYGLAGGGVLEKDIRQRAIAKMLKDRLVEAGINAKPIHGAGKHGGAAGYDDEMGRQWWIFSPDMWRERMKQGRLPQFIVFADRAERDEFIRALALERSGTIDRLRLGMKTGRVKLTTAKETAGA